jgi:hypothetical protein
MAMPSVGSEVHSKARTQISDAFDLVQKPAIDI